MSNSPSGRWRAPQLRVTVESEGINHASWIELFFDLVFVIVIAELSHYFSEHLSFVPSTIISLASLLFAGTTR
jgi:low temperature requirement protein LtrA